MLETNIYNIDREFDYDTVKSIVVKSLEKIVKDEALKNIPKTPSLILKIMTIPTMSKCLPHPLLLY
jgi:uncharacterized Fe-S cluster-containing protein